MPLFYLDLCNGVGFVPDDDGIDYPDQAAAHVAAIESIRSIVAEEARRGSLDLTGYVDIRDAERNDLLRVEFVEAFRIRQP